MYSPKNQDRLAPAAAQNVPNTKEEKAEKLKRQRERERDS
jgi:hypothetical protein